MSEKCICCHKNEVSWPRVCSDCTDHEAQYEIASGNGFESGWECRTCGMLYDGGMRCTYCGDIDPLDTGEFHEDNDLIRSDEDE